MRRPSRRSAGASRWTWLDRIGGFVTRRSRLVVCGWLLAVFALAAVGKDLDDQVKTEPLYIPGTPSARAHQLARETFGAEDTMVVTLTGGRAGVASQGRDLARRLDAMPRSVVVSPWSSNVAIDGLRPSPGTAAIIVRFAGEGEDSAGALRRVRRAIDGSVASPVDASIAGVPSVVESYSNAGNDAAAAGELIAAPILLLVLLLVFRSVIAAVLPLLVGGAVVIATRGVLSLLLGAVHIEAFAVSLVGMIGLALGVDYSLLVVSRFREERAGADSDSAATVRATVRTTGRSIVPAGCGLLLAALAASQIMPGSVIASGAIAVSVATVLSMVSAICVTPALLAVLGDNVDRWALPRRGATRWALLPILRRVSASPLATGAIMLFLVLCSVWAFNLNSSVATADLLPPEDPGRQQQDQVGKALGSGWLAPMEVVVDGRGSPITSPERLRALAAFERRVESDPDVRTMAGFSPLVRNLDQLEGVEDSLAGQAKGLDRLGDGLARAHGGAARTADGFLAAAEGARRLGAGIGSARTGARAFAAGLSATSTGSSRLAKGLSRTDEGTGSLSEGTSKVSRGIGRLAGGLERAKRQTGELLGSSRLVKNAMRTGTDRLSELKDPIEATEARLSSAWSALERMSVGRGDPEYEAALRAVEEATERLSGTNPRTGEQTEPSGGVDDGLERAQGQFDLGLYLAARMDKSGNQARRGVGKLARASDRLDRGVQRVAGGTRELSRAIDALADGGGELSPAMRRLSQGAERLVDGLGQLGSGADGLAGGLGGGARKASLLAGGLGRIGSKLDQQAGGQNGAQLTQLREQSPGLFRSGYFFMAGLDGSPPEQRDRVNFLVNLNRGGLAARMMVIPTTDVTDPQIAGVRDRLELNADRLARQTGTNVIVGGPAIDQLDINDTYRDKSLLIRIALSLITVIVLIPVMRSLIVPLLVALLNVIAVSATFGLMALLFDGSFLGGPGYIDATVIPVAMMILFGLATDYEVFVFARIREEYVRTGSTEKAISGGLGQIAPVVTGAALIMIAVFLAFSLSSFMTIRNLGVALTIGIFIDAFIIRLVLIPALMRALGDRSWWMPRWLDRLMPGESRVPAEARAA
jgi:putative drug exporter of the RND superfamily